MNKMKRWIALILAIVLVGATVIYQAGDKLSASESTVNDNGESTDTVNEQEPQTGETADTDTEDNGTSTGSSDVNVKEVPGQQENEAATQEGQPEGQNSVAVTPSLSVDNGKVTGVGYDQVRIRFNCTEVNDQNNYFRLHVSTEASARANGFNLNNGVGDNMNKNWTQEYGLYNLAQKEFQVWVEPADANKSLSVEASVEGDLITFTLSDKYVSHYNGRTFVCPSAASLGSVNDFAVFAKEYENYADMEGNIATKKLHAGTNGGNTQAIIGTDNNLSYVEEFTNFGNINTIFFRGADPLIVGDAYSINKSSSTSCYDLTRDGITKSVGTINSVSDTVNIKNSSYQIDFDKAFSGLEAYASSLYGKTVSTGITYEKNDNKVSAIKFPKENQNYIINVKLSEMNKWYDHVKLEGLGDTGSVVFNVEYDKAETLDQPQHFDLNGVLTGYEKNAGRILLNFGTQQGGIVIGHCDSAVVLAPDADVSISGTTHNGSVFAQKVTNTGAEIHKNPWKPGPDREEEKEEKVDASAKLTGKKYVDDREATAGDGYQFTLTRTDADYSTALDGDDAYSDTVTVKDKGAFAFELKYDKAGIYYYTVSEVGAGSVQDHVYYDETVYHVQVTVSDKGEVTIGKTAVPYEGAEEEEIDEDAVLEFHNYGLMLMSMEYAQARITGTKTLTGGDLKAGEFRFGLYEGDTLIDTATNDANGKIAFRTLPYYTSGTHHYTVKEIDVPDTDADMNTDMIEYDSSVYDVDVSVSDDMDVAISYSKDGEPVDGITFENKTSSTAAVIDPSVTKVLENGVLQPGQFSFQLLDDKGQVLDTKRNTDNGSVLFDSITYDKEGTYDYTIKEVIPEDVGQITYDTKDIKVEVKVEKDSQTGNLHASVTYYKDGKETENPKFINAYNALSIRVQKKSRDGSGDPLQGAVYALYKVMGESGRDLLIGTQTSGADGYMTFTDMEPGVYYFKEVSAPAGHTVDEYATERFMLTADGRVIYGGAADTQSMTSLMNLPVTLSADDSQAEKQPQTLAAETKGVSDEVTKLNVSKLDATSHEYVSGAKMQIIEKSSGEVVCEWTTGESTKAIERMLNVDTIYILHEAAAPDGYDVAQDTEFSLDIYGNLTVISGSDAEKKGDISLNLYDKKLSGTKTITNNKENRKDRFVDVVKTVRTGDNAKIGLLAVLVIAAAVVIIVMIRRKMKNR